MKKLLFLVLSIFILSGCSGTQRYNVMCNTLDDNLNESSEAEVRIFTVEKDGRVIKVEKLPYVDEDTSVVIPTEEMQQLQESMNYYVGTYDFLKTAKDIVEILVGEKSGCVVEKKLYD